MISKNSIGSSGDAAKYFDDALKKDGNISKGADNYYVNGESEMTWHGKGAEVLGLEGKAVTREQFLDFLDGKVLNPETGEIQDLTPANGQGRRAGIDLTISAPKSVSVVGLVGGDEGVIEAHEKACLAAMGYIEQSAQFRSRDGGKAEYSTSGNLVWGTVQHSTNRLNEPDLHNHNVVPAITWDKKSGEWRSLTNDEIFNIRASADKVYKSELCRSLKELGYEIQSGKNGEFEIKGAAEHNNAFSQRSQSIKDKLTEWGVDPTKATRDQRQSATLATRPAKGEITEVQAKANWLAVAKDNGFDAEKLVSDAKNRSSAAADLRNDQSKSIAYADPELVAGGYAALAVKMAVVHLSERESVFKVSALVTEAIKFGEPGAFGVNHVNAAIEKLSKTGDLVHRSLDKDVVGLTTKGAIEKEQSIERIMKAGQGKGHAIIKSKKDLDGLIVGYEKRQQIKEGRPDWKFSEGQRQAVTNALMHPSQFQVIQGVAGAGKTAAAAFVKEVVESRGGEIIGVAPTGKAKGALAKETGIKSQTLAAFLKDVDRVPKLIQKDIDALKKKFSGAASGKDKTYLESDLRTVGIGAKKDRYVIDNKTGDVFRANMGLSNIKNSLADAAAESGRRGDRQGQRDWRKNSDQEKAAVADGADYDIDKTIGRYLAAAGLVVGSKLIGNFASESITWTKCGGIVATAIKAQVAWEDRSIKADIDKLETQLKNFKETGSREGKKVTLIADEFSFVDVKDAHELVKVCAERNITLIAQGDKTQISGVGAGAGTLFGRMQSVPETPVANLTESVRFNNANKELKTSQKLWHGVTDKNGEVVVKQDRVAAVKELTQPEVDADSLAKTVAARYMAKSGEYRAEQQSQTVVGGNAPKLKTVGVVTVTNDDRNAINREIHDLRYAAGELSGREFEKAYSGNVHLTSVEKTHVTSLIDAGITAFEVVQNSEEFGLKKGEKLTIAEFDAGANTVSVFRKDEPPTVINLNIKEYGEVLNPTNEEFRTYAAGEKVTARANIGERFEKEIGPQGWSVNKRDDKGNEVENVKQIRNGDMGVILEIDEKSTLIRWGDGKDGFETRLSNAEMRQVDYGSAQTAFKEQGQTNAWELVAVGSKGVAGFAENVANVAITRAKDGCEVFSTAVEKMLTAVGGNEEKSLATNIGLDSAVVKQNSDVRAAVESSKDLFKGQNYAAKIEKVTLPEVIGDSEALHKAAAKHYLDVRHDLKVNVEGIYAPTPNGNSGYTTKGVESLRRDEIGQKALSKPGSKKEIADIAKENHREANAVLKSLGLSTDDGQSTAKREFPVRADFEGEIADIAKENHREANAVLKSLGLSTDDGQSTAKREDKGRQVTVGLRALTDTDRKGLNQAVHEQRMAAGEIGQQEYIKVVAEVPRLTEAQRKDVRSLMDARVDSFEAVRGDRNIGVKPGDHVQVVAMDSEKNTVAIVAPDGKVKTFDPSQNSSMTPTREETRAFSKNDDVVARLSIGDKTRKDPDGKIVPNEVRIEKGTKGTVIEIDAKGAAVEWRTANQTITTYLSNEVMRHLDLGYANTASRDPGQGRLAPNVVDIVVVSETALMALQREAVSLAGKASINKVEIVTNCKADMLAAVGKEPEKVTPKDLAERKREQNQQRNDDKGRHDEPHKDGERKGPQREMGM